MTKFFTNQFLKYTMAVSLGVAILSSCKKTESDTTAYTAITVYNASPTAATYDVFLGDKQLNTVALPLGGGIAYSQQLAGSYDLKFTIPGRSESVITKNVSLNQNTFNSFYLIGKPGSFDGIFTTDNVSATSTTQAFVRFINLSSDAPALNLSITGGAIVGTSQSYKGIGSFVQINAGTYSFDVKDNATAAVKTTLLGIALVANGYYTIVARGLLTPVLASELPFGAQVVINR